MPYKQMNGKTVFQQIKLFALAFAVLFGLVFAGLAPLEVRADEQPVEIWSFKDLSKITENPSGNYQLMADIDLRGRVWTPIDFSGTLNGNGHAIINASINTVGAATHTTYDGNMVSYDTDFSGFFSSLINASVSNVKFLGIEVSVDNSDPTFIGGIAGYMENSQITDCSLYGKITLYTSGASFGVGGIAGFGNGKISGTSSEMTLVCVDKDHVNKDEQFLGGAYAAGYIDLENNEIKLDGYDSDHGYVHDGGLVGMYILYPEETWYEGVITGNTVSGQITFFEDNEDRRAYCEAFIGEVMNWSFVSDESFSEENFTGTEVDDYSTVLLPHNCTEPKFEQNYVASTETENGFVEYICSECGYRYKSDFMPVVGNYVDPDEVAVPGVPQVKAPEPVKSGGKQLVLIIVIAVLVVILVIVLILLIRRKKRAEQNVEIPENVIEEEQ